MSGIVYFIALLVLSIWEVWMVYAVLEEIFYLKSIKTKWYIVVKWGNILTLGILMALNRMLAFSSRSLVILCTLVTFICVNRFVRRKKGVIFCVVSFCYIFLTILDFIFSFICIEFLGTEFERIVYVEEYSGWAIGIYGLARIVMWMVWYKLTKSASGEMNSILAAHKKVFFLALVFLLIIMIRYQFVLIEMAAGEWEIQGVDKALVLVAILVLMTIGSFFCFQYALKIREIEFLKLQEQMLRNRCREMQKTRQIAHDMRNHVMTLKKYDNERNGEQLHEYIQNLGQELTLYETQVWTGIEILDYLLTQEKKKADQRNIAFQIETQRIDELPFSDVEIVSVFGNLLDNAIEACEKMKTEKRWIHVLLKKQRHMFFMEIVNSVEQEADQKNVEKNKEGGLHGYGLINVRQIVERHKGEMNCQATGGEYSVTIIMYRKGKDEDEKRENF